MCRNVWFFSGQLLFIGKPKWDTRNENVTNSTDMEMGEYESFIKRLRNDGNYSYQNVSDFN